MKRLEMILMLLVYVFALYGQQQWDNPKTMVEEKYLKWQKTCVDIDGYKYIFWLSNLNNNLDIYGQKLDSNNTPLWGHRGKVIVNKVSDQYNIKAIVTSDNMIILNWVEQRQTTPEIASGHLLKIDQNGDPVWDNYGILIYLFNFELIDTFERVKNPFNIVADLHGGCYTVFEDNLGFFINHYNTDANSEFLHLANVSGLNMENKSMFALDSNGSLMVSSIINQSNTNLILEVYRISASGDTESLWCDTFQQNEFLQLFKFNADFYLFKFSNPDTITGYKYDEEFSLQDSVQILLNDGILFSSFTISTADSSIVLMWKPTDILQNAFQSIKLSENLDLLWDSPRNMGPVFDPTGYISNFKQYISQDGSIYLYCRDYNYIDNLYKYDSNGNYQWNNPLTGFNCGLNYYGYLEDDDIYFINLVIDSDTTIAFAVQGFDSQGNSLTGGTEPQWISNTLAYDIFSYRVTEFDNEPYIIFSIDDNLFIQGMDNNGNLKYEKPGKLLYSAGTGINFAKLLFAESNPTGIYLGWSEHSGTEIFKTVKLNENMDLEWITTSPETDRYANHFVTGDSVFILTSRNTSPGSSSYWIIAQKIVNGYTCWETSGNEIALSENFLSVAYFDGQFLVWRNQVLRCSRIDSNGNIAVGWNLDGLEIGANYAEIKVLRADDNYLIFSRPYYMSTNTDYRLISGNGTLVWPAEFVSKQKVLSNSVFYKDQILYQLEAVENVTNSIRRLSHRYGLGANGLEALGTPVQVDDINVGLTDSIGFMYNYAEWSASFDLGNYFIYLTNLGNLTCRKMDLDGHLDPYSNGLEILSSEYNGKNYQITQANGSDKFLIYTKNHIIGGTNFNVLLYNFESIVNNEDPVKPKELTLLQNFPNPFNPTTCISFNLPQKQKVELSIYNIKGQLVKKLANGMLDKGVHKVIWNGQNEDSKPAASGVYFYKLKANPETITRKMMLLK